jgi:hypothetical protein
MSRSYTLDQTALPPFRSSILSGSLSNHQYSIFQKMTMQVYPLKADMAALRRFIDSYLNFVDDVERPPFYFQPAFPYVLMQLVHYPRLAVPTQNLTSFRQHELTFSMLLECYQVQEGKLVFKQFAVCTPFIYLDQGVSIVGGRSLFGWPKVALRFDNVFPPDIPTADAQQVNLKLRVPSITGDKYVTFIEAYRAPRPFVSMRKAPAESITTVADAVSAYFSAGAEDWYSTLRFPSGGYEQARDIESMQAMAQSMGQQFSAFLPMFPFYRLAPEPYTSTADVLLGPSYMDIITIKQIRDAERTDCAAFQSVVRSTMYLDRFYDYGWLCDPRGADPTSDIRIVIHNEPDQQVVESLGLEVSDQAGHEHQRVAILKPRFPYWFNADMVYGLGTNLYWRGVKTSWSSCEFPTPGPPDPRPNPPAPHPKPSSGKFGSRYSTFGGGAQQENPLAVVSPRGLIYIATLPLDPLNGEETLRELVKHLLSNRDYEFDLYKHETKPRPAYIWLIVRNINDSGVGLPPSKEQELVLGAFVKWRKKGDANAKWPGIGFMPLYAITDSQSRALTHSEVFGRPIVLGEFEYLGAKWPWPSVGVNSSRNTEFDVLVAKTSILKTLFSGATPEMRELIRITAQLPGQGPPLTDQERTENRISQEHEDAQPSDAENGDELNFTIVKSTSQKPDQTEPPPPDQTQPPPPDQTEPPPTDQTKPPPRDQTGPPPLKYPGSMITVSLAQVIDCRLPENDSYQAIVMQLVKSYDDQPITITSPLESASGSVLRTGSVSQVRSFELLIEFTRYDSVPIVKAFGLSVEPPAQGPDATIEIVKAKSHGWIDTPVEENGSIDFAWRLGASDWEYPQDGDWLSKLKQLDPATEKKMDELRNFIAEF